jgi:hypothetical protein
MELVKIAVRPPLQTILLGFLQASCFLFASVIPAWPENLWSDE